MSRRNDRRHIFCLIFQHEFHSSADISAMFDSYMENYAENGIDKEFVYREFSGACQNLERVDLVISQNLKSWTTDRLNKADLAILRLAVYEMLYIDEVPMSVSINEAVELAKTYAEDDSPGFINAILGDIAKVLDGGNI